MTQTETIKSLALRSDFSTKALRFLLLHGYLKEGPQPDTVVCDDCLAGVLANPDARRPAWPGRRGDLIERIGRIHLYQTTIPPGFLLLRPDHSFQRYSHLDDARADARSDLRFRARSAPGERSARLLLTESELSLLIDLLPDTHASALLRRKLARAQKRL